MASAMLHASLLPTIKCSNCGSEIEISMMGDHACQADEGGEEEDNVHRDRTDHDRIDTQPASKPAVKVEPEPQRNTLEADLMILPRTSFVRPTKTKPAPISTVAANQLDESSIAPNNLPPPRSALPSSSFNDDEDMAFRAPPKSATLPRESVGELGKSGQNNDKSDTSASNGQMWPLSNNVQSFAPPSPKLVTGGSLLQRMNSIAPGPFNSKARKLHSKKSSVSPNIPASNSPLEDLPRGPPPPRPARPNRPEELLDHSPDLEDDGRRLAHSVEENTTDAVTSEQGHLRRHSSVYTTAESEKRDTNSLNLDYEADMSSPPPLPSDQPRLPSRDRQLDQGRFEINSNKSHVSSSPIREARNPEHTPTMSVSSSASRNTFDDRPQSSRSSPPTSNGSILSHGQHSLDQLSPVVETHAPNTLQAVSERVSEDLTETGEREHRASLVSKFNREENPDASQIGAPKSPRRPSPARNATLESKIQRAESQFRKAKPSAMRKNNDGAKERQGMGDTLRPAISQRKTSSSKGDCRGCGTEIIGKSIRAADGRLSGRYHRECFCCKTCNEPFPTADFYVLNDNPYCAHHYHVLNRSLCFSCNQGIEGRYLETQPGMIYHTECFTCHDCRRPLSRDYFEINNQVYCDADAMRAYKKTQLLAPGRRFPEKRTTRLMMM